MPLNPLIAKRYAGALYQLTVDKSATTFFGKGPQILMELNSFLGGVKAIPEGMSFYLNPTISSDDKIATLKELESRLPLTSRFLGILIEANRFEYLEEIIHSFQRACEEALGELSVDVEFAHEASAAMLEEVRSALHAEWKKIIKIRSILKPSIVGGFVAKAPGRVMDVSVASQLEALEQQLIA